MIKQAPNPARIAAMVAFTLSCVGLLLFLWISFGGAIPLGPKSYRFKVAVPEAATLAPEASVRIAGVDVGRVKKMELGTGARTLVEIEVESRYAPISRDARAILRQKTLLGETYIELAPGDRGAGALPDGDRLPDAQVEPSVELDEIADAFDEPTQRALSEGAGELAKGLGRGRAQDLNDALGNLPGFAGDAETLLAVLEREELSLRRLVRNGGVVLGALNERRNALRELVVHSGATFDALASQDDALAESVHILPTFLDEARATTARIERSLTGAAPVVRDLGPAADDLHPTLRDLGDLAPDLEAAFRALPPLVEASRSGLPALERIARGAGPVVDAVPPFARELNPIVSMFGFYQQRIADFIANGAGALQYLIGGEHVAPNTAVIDPRSFESIVERPEWDRGNAYLQPNALNRLIALGAYEASDCSRAIGPRNRFGDVKRYDAVDEEQPAKSTARRPPCLVAGPSLYDGRLYNLPPRGRAPVKGPPTGTAGTLPIERRP